MKYVRLLLEKDPVVQVPVTVYPWEVPILNVSYGPDLVRPEKVVDGEDREIDPAIEYARLQRKYGMDPENRIPYVQLAFGMEHTGGLATAIAEALRNQDGIAAKFHLSDASGEQVADGSPESDTFLDTDPDHPETAEELPNDRAGLIARLDAIGVDYDASAHPKTLKKLLQDATTSGGDDA